MNHPRREALRNYFLAVAQDLALRGVVRRRAGQPLEDILRTEPAAVLQQVREDFAAVAVELGVSFLDGSARMLGAAQHPMAQMAAVGVRALAEALFPGKSAKKG